MHLEVDCPGARALIRRLPPGLSTLKHSERKALVLGKSVVPGASKWCITYGIRKILTDHNNKPELIVHLK